MYLELQSLRWLSSGNIWVLVLFVGLHKCSRFPCCTQILRFKSCSQATFRWISRLLNFRDSCCRITWWHINNLAADGSGRKEFQIVVLNWAKLHKLEARLNMLASSLWLLLTTPLSPSLCPGAWWIFPHNSFVRANGCCSFKMAFSILKKFCWRGPDPLYLLGIQQF